MCRGGTAKAALCSDVAYSTAGLDPDDSKSPAPPGGGDKTIANYEFHSYNYRIYTQSCSENLLERKRAQSAGATVLTSQIKSDGRPDSNSLSSAEAGREACQRLQANSSRFNQKANIN